MEMSEAEMDQLLGYLDKYGLAATSEAWGLTEEEIKDIYPAMEMLDSKDDDEWNPDGSDDIPLEQVYLDSYPEDEIVSEGIDLSMPKDGKFAELTDEQIDNIQNFIPAARLGKVVKAGKSMFGDAMNKLFASSKLKANQLANRGSTGEVVKGASRKLKDSNLRPAIPMATANKYSKMANKVKQRRAELTGAGVLTGGLLLNRGLQGDRDSEGNLKPVTGHPELVVPEEPKVQETMGNQFGYHKQEGQNFWTVNNDDSYWDTHEMGTGDAWSDADVKEVVQELDWSSWFK